MPINDNGDLSGYVLKLEKVIDKCSADWAAAHQWYINKKGL